MHMRTDVMVVAVDVFGLWTQLGEPCELKSAPVVFKRLAINVGFSADDTELALLHF